MVLADLPALLDIADIVHSTYPEDAAVFEERLKLFPAGCLVLECAPRRRGNDLAPPGRGRCVAPGEGVSPFGRSQQEGLAPLAAPSPGSLSDPTSPRWGEVKEVGRPIGYIVSHPWTYGAPPALNSLLGTLPEPPTTYYIHDIALLPEARGTGAANIIVAQLTALAESLSLLNLSLIAVNDSVAFWQRHGFVLTAIPALDAKLRSYDEAARFMVRAIG
jgi:ribosomal protein S18 acetylase RimI-like enzyme